MSRLKTSDDLAAYMCQLHSIVLSSLCDHTRIKCVDSSTSFQFVSCPIRFIEELELKHPYHPLVIQSLHTFHTKYDGCSCKTFLFFLTTFSHRLHSLFDKNNAAFQQKIFSHLEHFIDQSALVARQQFTESLLLTADTFRRVCRYQTIYAESLYQAYIHFLSTKQSDLIAHFDHLHHLTRVKFSEEKCLFVPGTLLPTNKSIDGCRRTILIEGHLLEDYVHLGYNNQIKLKQTSSTASWTKMMVSILEEYSVEVVICSGTVDHKLKDIDDDKRMFIENISVKTLRSFGPTSPLTYLTDLTDEDVLLVNYMPCPDDPSLTLIEKGCTIIQYVPLQTLVDLKREQFLHCLSRFRHILRSNFYLNGSGQFEDSLYRYWYQRRENSSLEKNLACECFLDCLQSFVRELTHRAECFESNVIDDFDSKFDAWRTSVELLKILLQIDHVVEIVTDECYSDF